MLHGLPQMIGNLHPRNSFASSLDVLSPKTFHRQIREGPGQGWCWFSRMFSLHTWLNNRKLSFGVCRQDSLILITNNNTHWSPSFTPIIGWIVPSGFSNLSLCKIIHSVCKVLADAVLPRITSDDIHFTSLNSKSSHTWILWTLLRSKTRILFPLWTRLLK